jgi:hypothetical protein
MNSPFGCHLKHGNDGCLYGHMRKKYTRNHPYPENTMRVKLLRREKATSIKLRQLGYPINMIARFTGRSTSAIHRWLRAALMRNSISNIDMRKLPSSVRMRCSSIRWRTLQKYWAAWEAFLLGEVDKPP